MIGCNNYHCNETSFLYSAMLCNSISHLFSTWYLNLIYFTLCFSYGGHLIEIDGINLNKIVGQEAESLIRGPVWIGKNDWHCLAQARY